MAHYPKIRASLVSTNSISQGDQVAILWKPLLEKGIKIDFAWRTFKWSNEAKGKAAVHCVIIGFSMNGLAPQKKIFDDVQVFDADNINPYLVDAPDVLVESRSKPVNAPVPVVFGNMANDNGHLFIRDQQELENLLSREPQAEKYIRLFVGADEFINKSKRWCLWLQGASPSEINHMLEIRKKVQQVREYRLASTRERTRFLGNTPALFGEIRQPETRYILIPRHSSENRKYIPIGFMDASIICGDANMLIASDSLYHFGILTSNAHMAWMRTVAGRLKSDYRYSKDIVYNNFIWPDCTPEQKTKIERAAQGILDARAKYPNDSYADLYDDTVMPHDLRRAHQENDRAVWEAYSRAWPIGDESACVAQLMKLYQTKVSRIC